MELIFYSFGILAILWEITVLQNTKRIISLRDRLRGKKAEDMTSNEKTVTFLMFFYFVWGFVGLLSSQWVLFLALLLMSFIPKPAIFLKKVDAFITIILVLFIVINKVHLNIDLLEFLNLSN